MDHTRSMTVNRSQRGPGGGKGQKNLSHSTQSIAVEGSSCDVGGRKVPELEEGQLNGGDSPSYGKGRSQLRWKRTLTRARIDSPGFLVLKDEGEKDPSVSNPNEKGGQKAGAFKSEMGENIRSEYRGGRGKADVFWVLP